MIPSPNLDDRTFEDIVDEAIRLIPQYCPEWTNFNKSDPGITLIELFAWMSEMIIYRLNKVPEKNYLAFLELMGIQRQPPQPARTVLTFNISDKTDVVTVPQSTQVATRATGDRNATTFETENELTVIQNSIARCVSQYHDQYSDLTPYIGGRQPFEIFEGVRTVDRYVYIGDVRLEHLTEAAVLTLSFECPNAGERAFAKMLDWEYWNGERWQTLETATIEASANEVTFWGPSNFNPCTVNDVESYWIRGRLFEVPLSYDETVVDLVSGKLEVLGEGVSPDLSYFNPQGEAYLSLDLDRNFKPFGHEPRIDNFLYISSDSVFSQPNTTVTIEIELSDPSIVEKPAASADLIQEWQYFNGKRWRTLAKTGPGYEQPTGKAKAKENPFNMIDGTRALTQNGRLTFQRPDDMTPVGVNGQKHHWLRCRILKGGYGSKGSYELVDDRWVYQDEHPLRPPSLKRLALRFSEPYLPFANVLTYNDFLFTEQSKLAATEYKPFQAFQPVPEENPTLYLGFENALPNEKLQLYFNILDPGSLTGTRTQKVFAGEHTQDTYTEQTVIWEHWTGKEWKALFPTDGTQNFTGCGFVQFTAPKVHRKSRRYGEHLYWLRARLEMGGYDEPPVCDRILLNSVYASNYTTYPETTLGSSQGTPNQSFWFNKGPVLPGQKITVREQEKPTPQDIENIRREEGENAFLDASDGDGFIVCWHEVESLYESGPKSRHYTKDITTGQVRFGDGVHGMIPPKGDRSIRAALHRVGGGQDGNVAAGSIVVLKNTLSYIESVNNPFAATGGADLEDLDDLKLRGPFMLKSRGRAVTREDFEWLAIQSSNSIARVKCIPGHKSEGQVTVVILPKVTDVERDFLLKPVPSTELLRRCQTYLDERKLLTTQVHVVKPKYRELSVKVEIMRRSSGSGDRIKREIDERVRHFIHPLTGGRDKRGWPFGRNVFKVDLFHVVEEVEGVDFVQQIHIYDEDNKVNVEQIRIEDDELPFLVKLEIFEKAPDKIL